MADVTNTNTALLDAAETLARRRGYNGFSFGHLAEQVGIRKASIHYHFDTKGALAERLISRYAAEMQEKLETLTASGSKNDQLQGFVDIYRAALGSGDTICLCAALSAELDSLPPRARDALDAFYDATLAWLEATFDTGDAPQKAASLLSLVEGAQLLARARRDITIFDQAVAPALAHFLQIEEHRT